MSRPIFVIFDNTRIKLKNIKDYGITTEIKTTYSFEVFSWQLYNGVISSYYGLKNAGYCNIDLPGYGYPPVQFWNAVEKNLRKLNDIYFIPGMRGGYAIKGKASYDKAIKECPKGYYEHDCFGEFKEVSRKRVDVLYITTYQRDKFYFFQDEVTFDIHAKIKEIDKYLAC